MQCSATNNQRQDLLSIVVNCGLKQQSESESTSVCRGKAVHSDGADRGSTARRTLRIPQGKGGEVFRGPSLESIYTGERNEALMYLYR